MNTHDIMSKTLSTFDIDDGIHYVRNKTKTTPIQNLIHCVSKQNIPDIFSCNSRKHCRIFI